MIDFIAAQMQRRLRARSIHVHCDYGTERFEREMPLPGTIEIDWSDGPDVYGPGAGTRSLPSAVGDMQAAGVMRAEVRVASAKAGATHAEHRRLARHVVDMLVLEMRAQLETMGLKMPSARGGFVDVPESEMPHGATYELDIDYARGVQIPTLANLDGVLIDGETQALVGSGIVRVTVGTAVGVVCEPPPPGDEEET